MFVLDTNVVSELRKAKSGNADANVVAWASVTPANEMYLSVISILELELGVLRLERKDKASGTSLRHWLDNKIPLAFEGRLLPVDTDVGRQCAALHVPNPRSERVALIAATAMVHGMHVVTRNESDFKPTGVALLNPWNTP